MAMKKTPPSFKIEKFYWNKDIEIVIGMDEVGRGAFAGPIVAAGVIFPREFKADFLSQIYDSKQVSPKLRIELSKFIKENSMWAIESVELDYINKHGIGMANQLVFRKVLSKLLPKNEKYFILSDGFNMKIGNQKGIIRGDSISLTIASASILAKVYRDDLMHEYAKDYPLYGFDTNVGYGTLKHREAINKHGLCELHRTSFNLNKFL
jgi:ribonuclease HII